LKLPKKNQLNMRRIKFLLFPLLLAFAACKVPGIPEQKKVQLPEVFSAHTDSVSIGKTHWKQFFPDALLIQYIEQAMLNNPDFLMALQQVAMAKAQLYGNS